MSNIWLWVLASVALLTALVLLSGADQGPGGVVWPVKVAELPYIPGPSIGSNEVRFTDPWDDKMTCGTSRKCPMDLLRPVLR
jgi:hypothetical protein